MGQPFYILLGWLLTGAVSLGLGRLLLRWLKLPLYREEEWGFGFLLGSALLSLLVFGLAASQLLYKGVLLALGVAVLAANWRLPWSESRFPALPRKWVLGAAIVVAPFALLTFCHAMAPEMSPDGSAYHLGFVAKYYRERGFSRITTNIYGNLSQGLEMLFLYAYAFGRHSAAALSHFNFLLALAWSILCFGRRFGMAGAGLGAACIVFVTPVIGVDAASAYNDVAVAAVLFGIFYLMQIWDRTRGRALLIAVGVLGGFAYGIKYTAFLGLVYALGFLLWRRQWRAVVVVGLVAALWVTPWMAKNAIVVANPISPFGNRIFANPYVHVSFEEEYAAHMRNYEGLKSKWEIPLEVTVRGQLLCGLLGPLFLLTPLCLFAWRRPFGKRVLFAALLFGAIYATNIGTRFLIGAVPFVALALALAASRVRGLVALIVVAHALSSWPDVLKLYCHTYAWRLDRISWRQALRLESEDGFLGRKWPAYQVARMIEKLVPAGGRVLTWNQTGEAYTSREILVPYQSAFGAVMGGILWTPLIPEYQPVRRLGFPLPDHQKVRRVRIRQTNGNSPDHFTVNEVRFYSKGNELARDRNWRIRAHPNPLDARYAFDNSPITRWGSWEKIHPGMFIEVAFQAPVEVDEVALEMSPDQGAVRLELDWWDAAGQISTIREARERELAPAIGLRREAMEVLREHGIGYMIVHDDDFGAKDFYGKQEQWGIQFVDNRGAFRLYAIR